MQRYTKALTTFNVLPFGTAAAQMYGMLATAVRHSGRTPRARRLDLQIAATAAANSMPLLTRNAADLVGLDRMLTVSSI